jgi:asparagine synthase (glutamine-hydrolysing)
MCGIAGIVDFETDMPPQEELLGRMTNALVHRGPDDSGVHTGPHVGLGHRRLSIIDLSGGRQPMSSTDGTKIIVFNGEIYNFQEIRTKLSGCGHVFGTRSDTEVLLKAYEQWGTECLQHLRGMFAFAIWDATAGRLFAARDRLGKKPLYYFRTRKKIFFASEVKALLELDGVDRSVNLDAIDCFLSLGFVLAPHTIFSRIEKLPAGHYLLFDRTGITNKRYWNLFEYDNLEKFKLAEAVSSVKRTLEEAVSLRMISDVPIGAYLSGGLDSSIIVGIMSRHSTQPVRTFTVGYVNAPEHSELEYARLVAKHFMTDHREIILEPGNFFDLIRKMVWHLEEPIGDQACIPLFLLSEKAREQVTVMLSGEGADELFGGYNIYLLMQVLGYYGKLPSYVRDKIGLFLLRKRLGHRRAIKYVEWSRKPLSRRYLGDMADLSEDAKSRLYTPEFSEACRRSSGPRIEEIYQEVPNSSAVDQMTYLDINTWLVEDLLLKADKMTMAASVELRTPFLDHELVEISRRVGSRAKIRGITKKWLLKEAYRDLLPRAIVSRAKKGFPVPLSAWFQEDLNDLVSDVLLSDRAKQRGYFNSRFIEGMIRDQRIGRADYSKTLWSLLVLEFWHRVFAEGNGG